MQRYISFLFRTSAIKRVYLVLGVTLTGIITILIGLLSTSAATAKTISPSASDTFVNSVGIVTHLGYRDTPYTLNWDKEDRSQNVSALLADLGIRHVRDSIPNATLRPTQAYMRPRLAQLYRDYGIKFIVPLDLRNQDSGRLTPNEITPYLEDYANNSIAVNGEKIVIRDFLEAIEGPNEYDRHHQQEERERNWGKNLKQYQSALYEKVKSNPRLAQLPVVMPSLIYTRYCSKTLGQFSDSIDYGNLHSYPNYPYFQIPTSNLNWHITNGQDCFGKKSIYVTETGYLTNGSGGINDTTIAKYISTLLPEFFLQPQIKHTYLYALLDTLPDLQPWGLIRTEYNGQEINGFKQFSLTPKPAYNAVKSLLSLLSESTWDSSHRSWNIPAVDLKPVDISFEQKQDSTHYLLLQKSTDDYFLLVWQQIEAFNPDRGNFDPPTDEMSISLPNNYQFQKIYQYDDNFMLRETSVEDGTNKLAIRVPDKVVVLQFQ